MKGRIEVAKVKNQRICKTTQMVGIVFTWKMQLLLHIPTLKQFMFAISSGIHVELFLESSNACDQMITGGW